MGKMRNAHNVLYEKPEGKRPLRRPRNRYIDGSIILKWVLSKQDGKL
jgi:hypothetical protein